MVTQEIEPSFQFNCIREKGKSEGEWASVVAQEMHWTETVERRQQVDALVQSKEGLESKQRLESEKLFLEDGTVVAELGQRLTLAFVSSQLNQQAESLKNEIRRENEETRAQTAIFKAKLEEKINDKEKARKATETKMEEKQKEMNRMSDDFRRYRFEVRKDLDLKQAEANRLRSMVIELEKSNAEAREEIGRMQMERDEVGQEMERRHGDLKREMEAAVKKSLDILTADLSFEREAFDRVLREKDLIQQDRDTHIEEVKGLRSTLLELEKSTSDTHAKNRQLQSQHELLLEDRKEMERNFAALERDKASAERSLMQLSQQIEDHKREVMKLVPDKQQIQEDRTQQAVKITELQKEVVQLSSTIYSLQKQEVGLQLKFSDLGRSNADAREKQEQMLMEFNALVKEKEDRKRFSEKLMEEKSLQGLEEQGRKMQEIVLKKAGDRTGED
ncbi:hypothetical protein NE237_012634 [Protea cynaroides]|uniref:Uncharacterized protein n=1 Tax=Protea cynaroides TaxID=273540 RepID=A0A9Q0GX51_9MAGN|nr:hypothetical protein NE237_012634 [Protea cynaroides]